MTPIVYQGALIYGSEGMINMTTNDLQLLNKDTGGRWELHEPDGKFFKVADKGDRFEWLEGGAGQADELADWIEGKVDTHRGRGENGYKALEMIHAVYESARCHEQVIMPMQTRLNPLDLMVESGHLVPERPGRYDIRAFLLRGERMQSDDAARTRPGVSRWAASAWPNTERSTGMPKVSWPPCWATLKWRWPASSSRTRRGVRCLWRAMTDFAAVHWYDRCGRAAGRRQHRRRGLGRAELREPAAKPKPSCAPASMCGTTSRQATTGRAGSA